MRTLPESSTARSNSEPTPKPVPTSLAAHETDPTLAAALFAAWSGDPAVVIASPPGAGKTRLVVHLAEQLQRRAGLRVAIAAQTRTQALDVTNRAAAIGARVALLGSRESRRPLDLDPRAGHLEGVNFLRNWRGIVVATTARWLWTSERDFTADICIVDEAWQMKYADLGGLGPLSAQIVLVGDPGQIAPVVTGDARRWRDWSAGPQRPAPQALLAAYPESVTRLNLRQTWRLGPPTTALIQPAFYPDLPFDSARPPRHIQLGESALPELSLQQVPVMAGPGDPVLAETAAERIRELIDGGVVVDASGQTTPLHPSDVAVITPHVEQASAIAARLADVPGVLIGTANQAQGLEREAVVVIHPLAGYREAPAFGTDLGRLCVALSRHRAHATVLVDADTDAVLRHAQAEAPGNTTLAVQQHVLDTLALS
ncbi:MAG: AAA family ATPase [Chloroflexi bacterium]|nr:AAA family ATPase [Chloroflexota bacterium]